MEHKEISNFTNKYELKHEKGFIRCPICGKDKAQVYPLKAEINRSTFNKLIEINPKTKLTDTFIANDLDRHFDDITLKILKGVCFKVQTFACIDCVDEIGRRHKFNKNRKILSHATRKL